MSRSSRAALTAAGALAVAAAGAGAGAGLYASLEPAKTKTVVASVTTVDSAEPVSSAVSGPSFNELYKRTYQGVVDLRVTSGASGSPFGGSQTSQAEGSGFVLDKHGNIVTNQHVVDGATSIKVKFWNGQTYNAKVVGQDDSTDLAVVKVSAPSSLLHPLTLGDSSNVKIGDTVIAIGSPFGLAGTLTNGIVSALNRTMDAPNNFSIGGAIQTDAPINHGNSGGPLIDALGRVIGVNSQIQSDSGGSDGVGFAIPSNTVRTVANQLIAGKSVEHAYLGITVGTSSTPPGAEASSVVDGTAASRAGLKSGDVIVKLDGKTITSQDDLSSVIDAHRPGDKISLTYVRNGSSHTVTVTLGKRPS
jgi:putative serine protease PepD